MKKFLALIMTVVFMFVIATPAFAAGGFVGPADVGQGNSVPGPNRYTNNPGLQQATDVGAQCGSGAGSGAFGFFGKDLNMAGGADGVKTGLNNSALCGNRQGNLP